MKSKIKVLLLDDFQNHAWLMMGLYDAISKHGYECYIGGGIEKHLEEKIPEKHICRGLNLTYSSTDNKFLVIRLAAILVNTIKTLVFIVKLRRLKMNVSLHRCQNFKYF